MNLVTESVIDLIEGYDSDDVVEKDFDMIMRVDAIKLSLMLNFEFATNSALNIALEMITRELYHHSS